MRRLASRLAGAPLSGGRSGVESAAMEPRRISDKIAWQRQKQAEHERQFQELLKSIAPPAAVASTAPMDREAQVRAGGAGRVRRVRH